CWRSPDLPSFPTRRSSDLAGALCRRLLNITPDAQTDHSIYCGVPSAVRFVLKILSILPNVTAIFCEISENGSNFEPVYINARVRTEEQTSELQSRENFGCR